MKKYRSNRDAIMRYIYSQRGLPARIARACFINPTSVDGWSQVPPTRVHMVAAILQLAPEDIRPDIFLGPYARPRRLPQYVLESIDAV